MNIYHDMTHAIEYQLDMAGVAKKTADGKHNVVARMALFVKMYERAVDAAGDDTLGRAISSAVEIMQALIDANYQLDWMDRSVCKCCESVRGYVHEDGCEVAAAEEFVKMWRETGTDSVHSEGDE